MINYKIFEFEQEDVFCPKCNCHPNQNNFCYECWELIEPIKEDQYKEFIPKCQPICTRCNITPVDYKDELCEECNNPEGDIRA